jgi:uncharacterized membrane protein YedE/YeeE
VNRAALLVGAAFGFLIAAAGLADYNMIHNALLLREFDMYFLMGSAVLTAAPLLVLLQRRGWRTPYGGALVVQKEPVKRQHIFGAAVFGGGWAVAGTCPVPALAMTAGGSGLGMIVMAGFFAGIAVRDAVVTRALRRSPAPDGGLVGELVPVTGCLPPSVQFREAASGPTRLPSAS